MRKFVRLGKDKTQHNIVAFGEAINTSPKLDLVEVGVGLQESISSNFQTYSKSYVAYFSSVFRVKPTVWRSSTCSSSLPRSMFKL